MERTQGAEQGVHASPPNLVWVTDFTHVRTWAGFRAGRHLHPNTITDQLRSLGTSPLGARNAPRDLVQQTTR